MMVIISRFFGVDPKAGAFYASVFGILILHAFCQTHTHIKDRMPKIAPTNTLKEIEAPSQAKQKNIWLAVPYSKVPHAFLPGLLIAHASEKQKILL